MQVNHQQCWSFVPSGAREYAPETSTKSGVLRRTLRRLGGQTIVSAFVLIDIGGLGFALVASIWLAPWVAINLTALVLGSLSWSEDRRIQRESATATRRQGEELQREAERQQQARHLREAEELREAERRQREEEDEREAQKSLQAALRQAQEQLREAEQRRYQEEKERETQRQQSEQAERLRQAEQQRREAEQRRRQAEKEREAQRNRRREHNRAATQFQSDWWIVLGVAPSANKDEIVRKYRHKIKQCHPDRLGGLAPELLQLAEEQAKALNGAYANAMRVRRYAPRNAAAA
jgi:flagellar biosynthesis GTPase FlhF